MDFSTDIPNVGQVIRVEAGNFFMETRVISRYGNGVNQGICLDTPHKSSLPNELLYEEEVWRVFFPQNSPLHKREVSVKVI